jgi:hypothetical protein
LSVTIFSPDVERSHLSRFDFTVVLNPVQQGKLNARGKIAVAPEERRVGKPAERCAQPKEEGTIQGVHPTGKTGKPGKRREIITAGKYRELAGNFFSKNRENL